MRALTGFVIGIIVVLLVIYLYPYLVSGGVNNLLSSLAGQNGTNGVCPSTITGRLSFSGGFNIDYSQPILIQDYQGNRIQIFLSSQIIQANRNYILGANYTVSGNPGFIGNGDCVIDATSITRV